MSRRKDMERFLGRKRLDPDYVGFRGRGSTGSGDVPLSGVTCSVCGRRRNVPVGIASEQGDRYICSTCEESGLPEAASDNLSLGDQQTSDEGT